ncbi:TPA: hypothetical protein ROX98_001804 [Bacillus pseudomycoides]|nr:hypothetical protein [Bacillus pseudomycoides]
MYKITFKMQYVIGIISTDSNAVTSVVSVEKEKVKIILVELDRIKKK